MLFGIIVNVCTISAAFISSVRSQGCYELGGAAPTGYKQSPVFCTSETAFIIPSGNAVPDTADIIECPEGLVCADHPDICVDRQYVQPACPSFKRPCNSCADGSKYACVSETEFALCIKQAPSPFKQKCPTAHHYCGYSANIVFTTSSWPCVSDPKLQSCTAADMVKSPPLPTSTSSSSSPSSIVSTFPSKTTSSLSACNFRTGTFPLLMDSTCKSYILCYMDGKTLKRADYACPNSYVFNSNTKKCVLSYLYNCPSVSN